MECPECLSFRNESNQIKNIPDHNNRIVHGFGDINSNIAFIGEGPGRLGAAVTGIPFTKDYSGQVIQKALVELGFSDNNLNNINKIFIPEKSSLKCFLTNLFRCYNYKILQKKNERDIRLYNYRNHCLNSHLSSEVTKLENLKRVAVIGDKTKQYTWDIFERNSYQIKLLTHPAKYKYKRMTIDQAVKEVVSQ